MYFFNFLDRTAIVSARLNDIEEDLNLKGTEYQTCVSILFVGYLLGQIPSNMMMTRVKPAWWMSGWMFAWAIVSTLNCLVQNYEGLLVCRFLLGITEAPFYPGAIFMISLFYNRKESATRMVSAQYPGSCIKKIKADLNASPSSLLETPLPALSLASLLQVFLPGLTANQGSRAGVGYS